MCIMKTRSLLIQKLMPRLSFISKEGQSWRPRDKKFWYRQKGLSTRFIHALHESPISFSSKVNAKIKFFRSRSKLKVKVTDKNFGKDREVLL